jgi:hypothetical protein
MSVAIGTAWAGLLANFAAGAFLLLRPFKVAISGDSAAPGPVYPLAVHEPKALRQGAA